MEGEQYVLRRGRRILVRTLDTNGSPPKRKREEPFVMVPLSWAEQAARATGTPKAFVWLWLLHLAWKAKSNTVSLPNGRLEEHGVQRHTKSRALRELEAAGLIRITGKRRKSPVVTLLR
jgi:hypothetical protein